MSFSFSSAPKANRSLWNDATDYSVPVPAEPAPVPAPAATPASAAGDASAAAPNAGADGNYPAADPDVQQIQDKLKNQSLGGASGRPPRGKFSGPERIWDGEEITDFGKFVVHLSTSKSCTQFRKHGHVDGEINTHDTILSANMPYLINAPESFESEMIGASSLKESIHNVEVTLDPTDPNSVMYSVSSFEDLQLKDVIVKGLRSMEWRKPSKIQEKALPQLLADPPKNMICQSQSGSGKTGTFVVAMLQRVDHTSPALQALVISPTRELARQTMDVVAKMSKYMELKVKLAVQDQAARESKAPRDFAGAQILIGTPGTIMGSANRREIRLDAVKIFILDEADVLISTGSMGEQTVNLEKRIPKTAQRLLFSATFPDGVSDLAGRVCSSAVKIMLKRDEMSVDSIRQFYMVCKSVQHKLEVLKAVYMILSVGNSIIFCEEKRTAETVDEHLRKDGHHTFLLHGGLQTQERDTVMDKFRNGEIKMLITTNVLARGIDIPTVALVVNFDIPIDYNTRQPDFETYLHRIGRTGRFGRGGTAISFVHDAKSYQEIQQIEEHFRRKIRRIETLGKDVSALEDDLNATYDSQGRKVAAKTNTDGEL